MGKPPQDLADVLGGPGIIPTAPTEVAVGIPADLLRRRPDIRRAELLAAARCSMIGVSQSELYPSFSLVGTLGWAVTDDGQSSMGDLFRSNSFGFSIGPSFRWNILNYGRIKNRVRVQDALFEQSLTNYRNVVLNAAREVEDATAGFLHSQTKAEYLKKSTQAAKRSLELSMTQYAGGVISYQPVLDSTQYLVDQQDQYARTKGDIAVNLIAMYKALGGGWRVRLGENFIPETVRIKMMQRTDWGDLLQIRNEKSSLESSKTVWRRPDW